MDGAVRGVGEELWRVITDQATAERYFHDTRIRSDFQVGSPVTYEIPDGEVTVRGEVLEADPSRRLSMMCSTESPWECGIVC
jgi:uncharacterized protein YndB with AHSA1/START domain